MLNEVGFQDTASPLLLQARYIRRRNDVNVKF